MLALLSTFRSHVETESIFTSIHQQLNGTIRANMVEHTSVQLHDALSDTLYTDKGGREDPTTCRKNISRSGMLVESAPNCRVDLLRWFQAWALPLCDFRCPLWLNSRVDTRMVCPVGKPTSQLKADFFSSTLFYSAFLDGLNHIGCVFICCVFRHI